MADSLLNELPTTDNLQDNDLFLVWKDNISQTRAIKKSDMRIASGSCGGGNPERSIIYAFSASNHKSILIKKGTSFTITYQGIDYVSQWDSDTVVDLSGQMVTAASVATERIDQINGRVFNIYIDINHNIVLSVRTDCPSDIDAGYTELNTMWIGAFSTLCVSVPLETTAIVPLARSSYSVGSSVTVKGAYRKTDSYGFHAFYTKVISALTVGSYYDVGTVPHTLAGFVAGDILPESVFCEGFKPIAYSTGYINAMGMVYDCDTNKAIDIYLQSGMGASTATVYGATHTVSRQQQNHQDDMRQVGKMLISDDEFSSAALGSNERTAIQGASDQATVGGHVDTVGKRMVSFIGCEEMCGYLWQWTRNVSANDGSDWSAYDGQASFGQTYAASFALIAGGNWRNGASCGSRCQSGNFARSRVDASIGGRGSSLLTKL